MHWRWQEDETPGTPWANMARDVSLLDELIGDPTALPTVRVYRWDRPAVSIGRLQDESTVVAAYPDLTAVRRPTGGLAVVHGGDVTLSVVVREADLPAAQTGGVLSSYRQIAGAVVEAFVNVGVPASLGRERSTGRASAVDCFAFAARCDVIARNGGEKLAGCAQRRTQGVLLQQMSIPCSHLRDERGFIGEFKLSFGRSIGVSRWLPVDTYTPV